MLFNYIGNLKFYLLLLSIFSINLNAITMVEVSKEESTSILEHSYVYLDDKKLTLKEIVQRDYFKPYHEESINIGVSKKAVWIHFQLENSSNESIEKALVLNSPSLESISLYKGLESKPLIQGISHDTMEHSSIYYSYNIKIPPHSFQNYYLRVSSKYTTFYFNLTTQDEKKFRHNDILKQAPRILMVGLLFGLMLYVLLLTFYSRDKSYFYYALYLFMILYHQVTFLGLTQIYLPHWFVVMDMKLLVVKLGLLLLSSIFFSISFLKIQSNTWLYKTYMFFMLIALVEIIIGNIPELYNLSLVLIIGVIFILFNFMAGIIAYGQGQKQARLFILGFAVVSVAYLMIISDTFAFSSFLDYFPNILMWATTIEALILTLAFADRYKILQAQKEEVDKNREEIIKNEVIEKTAQLNKVLKVKELLLKEVHHRVKNNLQIILSMVRLQSDKVIDKSSLEKFVNLENRINAISKTYNMLLPQEDFDAIDMEEYVESLVEDIHDSMCDNNCMIDIEIDVDVMLSLKKSVYVGLIINELVTNSYKYAFDKLEGFIEIELHEEMNLFTLKIKDNGVGFIYDKESTSLGLKLIHALVKEQLNGSIEMNTLNKTEYIIKFRL